MQAEKTLELGPGIFSNTELSNAEYHAGPGISKSGLDSIAKSPAVYRWMRSAPVDNEKTKALNMGTALHTLLLEPHLFDQQFAVLPELNLRTNAGKETKLIFKEENKGKIILSKEEDRELLLMTRSARAHPAAKFLLEDSGPIESSIYWNDEETGELCRIRPDKMLSDRPVIVDVKKTADINRFNKSIEDFRYHVQAAMYSDGFYRHYNERPTFVFLVVSETIECGRYPVRVFVLDDVDFGRGHELYCRDLDTYHYCNQSNQWGGFEIISRPAWAK